MTELVRIEYFQYGGYDTELVNFDLDLSKLLVNFGTDAE